MPVVATATALTALYFLLSGKGSAAFRNPEQLRRKVEKLPEGDTRTRALELVARIESEAHTYRGLARTSIEEFVTMGSVRQTTTEHLIQQRHTADDTFRRAMIDLLHVREQMLDTLSREEWEEVFG